MIISRAPAATPPSTAPASTAPASTASASTEPGSRTRPRRGFLSGLTFWMSMLYLLLLAVTALLIWNYGDRWWPATVLLFSPRWIMALPLLLLLPLALARHRRSLIILAAAAAVLVWPIMGLRLSARAVSGESNTPFLRLLTCNIHRQQLDEPAFKALLEELRPDVVALQDWSSTHEAGLFAVGGWYCRRDGELLLASRYPIGRAEPIALDEPPNPSFKIREGSAVFYSLQTPAGPVNLINLHLSSPHESLQALRELQSDAPIQVQFNSHARDLESASIERFLGRVDGPIVIVGDFNTPSESEIYSRHWGTFGDAFDMRGFGFGMTHVSTSSSVRIDHILLGNGWNATRCWLAPAAGSPHRPLIADVQRVDATGLPFARIDP